MKTETQPYLCPRCGLEPTTDLKRGRLKQIYTFCKVCGLSGKIKPTRGAAIASWNETVRKR